MELRILQSLALILLLHATYALALGFNHNISDRLGFRQTQTALATRSLLEGSPWFAYQIPIFGPPWGLPIEFPLYQWLTASLVAITGMPLMAAGRIVSILFFVTCLVAIWKILTFFRIEAAGKYLTLCLLLICPLYLFWSRTFMIQTCALSLWLWFTLFALRAVAKVCYQEMAIATVLGVLGATVKITMLVPFWLIVAGWIAVRCWKGTLGLKAAARLATFLLAVPVLAEEGWVRFTDSVIGQNELAASFMVSSKLHTWVFGTMSDRFSGELWQQVLSRMLPQILGAAALSFCLLLLLPLAGRYWRHVAACIALFFVPILVFPILHRAHDYYQTENALFLVMAAGFLVYGMWRGRLRVAAYLFFATVLVTCIYRYHSTFVPLLTTENSGWAPTVQQIQQHTKPDQLIVISGLDWDPELPFYSHRRAVMDRWFTPGQLQRRIRAAAPATVGDVIYCLDSRKESLGLRINQRIDEIRQHYGLEVARAFDDGTCLHYFDTTSASTRQLSDLPSIGTIDAPRENESAKGSIAIAGWALAGEPIRKITISIDGQKVASALFTLSRPDVVKAYPQYPGDPVCGYVAQVDISHLSRGSHTIVSSAVVDDDSSQPVSKRTFVVP